MLGFPTFMPKYLALGTPDIERIFTLYTVIIMKLETDLNKSGNYFYPFQM